MSGVADPALKQVGASSFPGPEAAMTTDHATQLQQQITRAWQRYTDATLDGRSDEAVLAYELIDRLLDRLPRPRESVE